MLPRMWILALLLTLVTAPAPPAGWSGTWSGSLVNLTPAPPKAPATSVEVTREIGPWPERPGACTPWKTTYREGGVVRQVKDYQLCRDAEGDGWFVDEGGGVRLTARWLGDALVSSFKYGNLILIDRTEVHGDVMDEDIITSDDQPATSGIVTLMPRSIQRLRLTRVRTPARVQ